MLLSLLKYLKKVLVHFLFPYVYKWVELNYKLVKLEDKIIITVKDISDQRKQEKERKLLEEAVHIESLKNEFFANISHEFRTPLNIILGTMQLMKRNIDNNKITWDSSLKLETHIDYIYVPIFFAIFYSVR